MALRRSRLFRWTDTFAVVGLLIISFWLPAYYAQTDEGREAVGEGAFTLPPARIGDRVVYELIAQWRDEEPVLVSPLFEVNFRAPLPGESPYEAWIVEEWIRPGQRVDLGFGEYHVQEEQRRFYYDEHHRKVWQERDWFTVWEDDARSGSTGSHPPHPVGLRTIDSGLQLRWPWRKTQQ